VANFDIGEDMRIKNQIWKQT